MYSIPNEAKLALKDGTYNKNYRFIVLGNDGTEDFVIDNNNLVKESVNLDEKMSSGTDIKFGLCEGSSLEFQYFDYPNITGRRIQAFIDVEYPSTTITTISQFSRYETIEITESGRYRAYSESENAFNKVYLFRGNDIVAYTPISSQGVTSCEFDAIAGDLIEVEWSQLPINDTFLQKINSLDTFSIPMGFFDVKESSRQASTGIIKVTAYNKLQSEYLDAKANNILANEFTNTSLGVTMYDIRRILLGGYQVQEAMLKNIERSQYGLGYDIDDKLTTTFTQSKGVESPINKYYTGTSNSIQLMLSMGIAFWELDASKIYQIEWVVDAEQYEDAYREYLLGVFNDAPLNVTGQNYINAITTSVTASASGVGVGWQNIFCVRLTKQDNTKEYYSKYAYLANLANTKGSLKDLTNKIFTGYKKIEFIYAITVSSYTGKFPNVTSSSDLVMLNGEPTEYTYYDNNGDAQHATYPAFSIPYTLFDVYEISGLSNADLITKSVNDMKNLADFSLRDIVSATYETQCQFGQLNRETDLFSGVELNQGEPLEIASKDMYSQLWADEGNVHKWRYLIITYKGLDSNGNETEYKLQRTVDEHGTDNYNMSDNWLFRNLIWTSEQVGAFADAMVQKMRNITWFPFELWCAGLPYAETGDKIEIPLGNETYTSYILQRQLKGIQNLQDTYINGTLDIF